MRPKAKITCRFATVSSTPRGKGRLMFLLVWLPLMVSGRSRSVVMVNAYRVCLYQLGPWQGTHCHIGERLTAFQRVYVVVVVLNLIGTLCLRSKETGGQNTYHHVCFMCQSTVVCLCVIGQFSTDVCLSSFRLCVRRIFNQSLDRLKSRNQHRKSFKVWANSLNSSG